MAEDKANPFKVGDIAVFIDEPPHNVPLSGAWVRGAQHIVLGVTGYYVKVVSADDKVHSRTHTSFVRLIP